MPVFLLQAQAPVLDRRRTLYPIPPLVKQVSTDPQLPRQRRHIPTSLHPFQSQPPELLRIPRPRLPHPQFPFPCKVSLSLLSQFWGSLQYRVQGTRGQATGNRVQGTGNRGAGDGGRKLGGGFRFPTLRAMRLRRRWELPSFVVREGTTTATATANATGTTKIRAWVGVQFIRLRFILRRGWGMGRERY